MTRHAGYMQPSSAGTMDFGIQAEDVREDALPMPQGPKGPRPQGPREEGHNTAKRHKMTTKPRSANGAADNAPNKQSISKTETKLIHAQDKSIAHQDDIRLVPMRYLNSKKT